MTLLFSVLDVSLSPPVAPADEKIKGKWQTMPSVWHNNVTNKNPLKKRPTRNTDHSSNSGFKFICLPRWDMELSLWTQIIVCPSLIVCPYSVRIRANRCMPTLRENFKYYFADFVPKGGGGGTVPQNRGPGGHFCFGPFSSFLSISKGSVRLG